MGEVKEGGEEMLADEVTVVPPNFHSKKKVPNCIFPSSVGMKVTNTCTAHVCTDFSAPYLYCEDKLLPGHR